MPTLVTILNIGRTEELIDGNALAPGATLVVDLEDPDVQKELRNDLDYAVLPAIQSPAGAAATAVLGAPSAEVADARTVAVQVNDIAGNPVTSRTVLTAYFSTDADGDAPGDGLATINLTAGANGSLVSADDNAATFVTEPDGTLDVVLTDAADADETVYLHVALPDGSIASSVAIAFVDDTP